MTERPILFSAPMVRALLTGTKTQTRRALSPSAPPATLAKQLARYGKPGDRLWVKEAWRASALYDALAPRDLPRDATIYYAAGDSRTLSVDGSASRLATAAALSPGPGRYRNSMFLPRWASRIALELVNVRVERLLAISEQDAVAEGIERRGAGWARYDEEGGETQSPTESYRTLWEAINDAGSWQSDPEVLVVEFRIVAAEKLGGESGAAGEA